MYPIEKYRYATTGKKVIAITTYAGKTVRGVALCHDEDTFDMEQGKRIAAARCAVKVAQKRLARAEQKMNEADEQGARAARHVENMENYYYDAQNELVEANEHLDEIMGEIG